MSVRSFFGGDLTLDNLNVTTINDLAYPIPSAAGTVVSANNAAINLTTGTPVSVTSVTVTAGTWTINILLPLSFPSGTTFLFEQLLIQNQNTFPATTVYWTVNDNRDTLLTSGGSNNWVRSWAFTYNFPATQTLYMWYQANFSGASSIPVIVATPAGQYTLKATQIA